MRKIVIGMGEALWDVLPEGKKLGGAPSNFAYHVSQFGLPATVVSAVGNDSLGTEILDILTPRGLADNIAKVDCPTGTVQVTLDAAGVPTYDICMDVAWDNIPFTPALEKLAEEVGAVCFGSLAQRSEVSRNTILRFLDLLPDEVLKVFDINLRQNFYSKELIEASLERCNILKINDEELIIVGRMFSYEGLSLEEKCHRLIENFNLDMLILTCGINGSYVFAKNENGFLTSFFETPSVIVADTVGAGDSFTGSFVAAILLGADIVKAHKLAVDVSAYVCTQSGAMPVLPPELLAACSN